jgi:hypothetical protein
MFKLYNRPFKLGLATSLSIFVAANVFSYLRAAKQYEIMKATSILSGVEMPNWGFPFQFWGYGELIYTDGSVGFALNFITISVASFAVGLLFRFLFQHRTSNNI